MEISRHWRLKDIRYRLAIPAEVNENGEIIVSQGSNAMREYVRQHLQQEGLENFGSSLAILTAAELSE